MAKNEQLIAARHRTPSPHVPGECMSRAELAEAANAWLIDHGQRQGALDAHYVGRLEQGRVRWPGREYRAAFRAVLGVKLDLELGFRPPARRGHELKAAVDPGDVLSPGEDERLTRAAGGLVSADQAALEAIEGVLRSVRRLEDQTSAAAVLPTVLNQRDLIERVAHDLRSPLRAKAVGLASEIHQYLGWLHLPQDNPGEAIVQLDRAAVLALEADDPVRLATALSFQSYTYQQTGDWRRAEALAAAAARDDRVYPGLRTYLHYQRAEILARQGEGKDAARLLSEADAIVENLPPAEELPESGYWYVPAFFLGERAFVLQALGDTQAARRSAAECLSALPEEWRNSEWAAERRQLGEE
ncbi:XRE family transcriptional regulator [Saccharopolyspora hattusasensis]|uniref:XRE family transcriptional regulator n=1 Tax=Saccharopolyspora hattusasensis TaxID=1128679 RepID=UPI003D98EF08